jgi:hypothetical protein
MVYIFNSYSSFQEIKLSSLFINELTLDTGVPILYFMMVPSHSLECQALLTFYTFQVHAAPHKHT